MINPQDIPLFVRGVGNELEKAGFDTYLVGGCVRDLLLGKKAKTGTLPYLNAHPSKFKLIFPDSFCNNDYGTVGVKITTKKLKVVHR
ncbi:MAG: hypothetical protein R3B60_01355 [Candidatus Paceibacterota bacterium]